MSNLTSVSAASKPKTERGQLHEDIAKTTHPKRKAFFVAHQEHFLPLLPDNNYITRLQQNVEPNTDSVIVAYQSIDKEPRGVKATMKEYQLEGLSFLVSFAKIIFQAKGLTDYVA